jgi:hypothetical protein
MKDKLFFPVILLLVIAIVIVVTKMLLRRKLAGSIREEFNANTRTDILQNVYDKHGIEKCDILDNKSVASSVYLDPLRFRKWKPSDGAANTDPNIEHCYYFADRDPNKILFKGEGDERSLANIGDPLSGASDGNNLCKKSSEMFTKVPFIKSVFDDNKSERTVHESLAYKKCVFEIDKSKVNSGTLNGFWDVLDITKTNSLSCNKQLTALRDEQQSYRKRILELFQMNEAMKLSMQNLKLVENAFRKQYRLVESDTSNTMRTKLNTCNISLQQTQSEYTKEKQDYELEVQQIEKFQADINARITSISYIVDDSNTDVKLVKTQNEDLKLRLGDITAESLTLKKQLDMIQVGYNTCIKQKDELEKQRYGLQSVLTDKVKAYNRLNDEYRTNQITNKQLEDEIANATIEENTLKEKLGIEVIQYDQCKSQQGMLDAEKLKFETDFTTEKKRYEDCTGYVATLDREIIQLLEEIARFKQQMSTVQRQTIDNTAQTTQAVYDINLKYMNDSVTLAKEKCQTQLRAQDELAKTIAQNTHPPDCVDIIRTCGC